MTQDDDQERKEAVLDDTDVTRQVAHVTGMSFESAATFAAFLSGRFAPRQSFKDAS